jgi:MFS family permease
VIFVLADRYPRAPFIRGALATMGLASIVASIAPNAIVLTAAIAAWSIGTGVAASLAQAHLVARDPDRRSRTMTRWTLMSTVGDLLAPCVLALVPTWRTGFVVAGALCLAFAVVLSLRRFPTAATVPDDPDEVPVPILAALREALRDRRLLAWLFATALCDLLDEILLVFAALRLAEAGASPAARSLAIAAFVAGGALGLVVTERILARERRAPILLHATALACAITYTAWLAIPHPLLFALVGATASPLYPLVAAQAYARRPDRAGLVLAASHLFAPLSLALPFVLGAIADRTSTLVALGLLVAQPLGVACIVVVDRAYPKAIPPAARARPHD